MEKPGLAEPLKLSLDLVGDAAPLARIDWDERDTILYALGVGAGHSAPERDLQFTTENTRGCELKALPSLLNVLCANHLPPRLEQMDKTPFLHAEQALRLVRPLPARGPAYVRSRIDAVYDKGAHALVVVVGELFADAAGLELIGEDRITMFVRGAGGFGGERDPSDAWPLPPRPADHRISQATRPEQALLYRLSGDRHPLHSDPQFARANGFERPILHGLCTFGFACRALVETLCADDAGGLRAMRGRFARPAFPGETLTTEIWRTAPGQAVFRVLNGEGEVIIDRGEAQAG
jgi:acyl dehydratase